MNKRVVIVSLLSLLVVIGWYWENMKLRELHPEWYRAAETPEQKENPVLPATQAGTQPTVQPATQAVAPAPAPATQSTSIRAAGGNGKSWLIGSSKFDPKGTDSQFPMGVMIDPQGAAISSVTLNRLRAKQGKEEPYVFQKPYQDLDAQYNRSLLTQAILVDGQKVELHAQS